MSPSSSSCNPVQCFGAFVLSLFPPVSHHPPPRFTSTFAQIWVHIYTFLVKYMLFYVRFCLQTHEQILTNIHTNTMKTKRQQHAILNTQQKVRNTQKWNENQAPSHLVAPQQMCVRASASEFSRRARIVLLGDTRPLRWTDSPCSRSSSRTRLALNLPFKQTQGQRRTGRPRRR